MFAGHKLTRSLTGMLLGCSAPAVAPGANTLPYPNPHSVNPCNPELGFGTGEVLGCTAPVVAGGADAIVFVADGRFHLEAIMIANPDIPAFRCLSTGLSRQAPLCYPF